MALNTLSETKHLSPKFLRNRFYLDEGEYEGFSGKVGYMSLKLEAKLTENKPCRLEISKVPLVGGETTLVVKAVDEGPDNDVPREITIPELHLFLKVATEAAPYAMLTDLLHKNLKTRIDEQHAKLGAELNDLAIIENELAINPNLP